VASALGFAAARFVRATLRALVRLAAAGALSPAVPAYLPCADPSLSCPQDRRSWAGLSVVAGRRCLIRVRCSDLRKPLSGDRSGGKAAPVQVREWESSRSGEIPDTGRLSSGLREPLSDCTDAVPIVGARFAGSRLPSAALVL
jgi:hypothetical protein